MAVTLAQAALTESNPLRRGVIEMFAQESAVFDSIPIEPISGNAYSYNEETALPGTAFRTVNEAYVESTGVVNPQTERLTILGGDADVDRFVLQTSQSSLGDHKAHQTRLKVRSAQSTYVDALFEGDQNANSKQFDGLRKRLTGAQVVESAAPVSDDAFLEELDALFGAVDGGPDVVFAHEAVIARLKAVFRRNGGYDFINQEISGRRDVTWNGVRFVDPGNHWSGRKILDVDPANGTDVYAVKWSDGIGDVGVMGISNGGVQAYDLGELQEKPAHRVRVEFYCGLVVQGGRAAARLSGVQLSA